LLKFDAEKETFHFQERQRQKQVHKVEERETFQVTFKGRTFLSSRANSSLRSSRRFSAKRGKEKTMCINNTAFSFYY